MSGTKHLLSGNKVKVLSLAALALLPLTTGCIEALAIATFGGVLWADLALLPIRSILGALALDLVNTL